jgi:hypothetical protein
MHNWEHFGRLPAYLLAATLVASCGGGGESSILSTNGQSSASISSSTTAVLAGLNKTAAFTVELKNGSTALVGKTVTAEVISGSAQLVSTSKITDAQGKAEFNLTSDAIGKGTIKITYTDANGDVANDTLSFEIVDGSSIVSKYTLQQLTTDNVVVSTSGNTKTNVTVVLKDPNGNLVKNGLVSFRLSTDLNRGRLNAASVTTNDSGQATVVIDGLNQTAGENILVVSYVDPIASKSEVLIPFSIINAYDVVLNTTSDVVKTGGGSVVLTAKVYNKSQALQKDANVSFKILSNEPIGSLEGCPQDVTKPADFKPLSVKPRLLGDLSASNVKTAENGQASVTLDINDNNNGKRRVIATVDDPISGASAVDCIDLILTGTNLVVDPTILNTSSEQSNKITATVKNGLGAGVQGIPVVFDGLNQTQITGIDGKAVSTPVKFAQSTRVIARNTELGLEASTDVVVSATGFQVEFVNVDGSPIVNNEGAINKDFKVRPTKTGTKLKLVSTLGAISPTTAQQDGEFVIRSATPGLARVDVVEIDDTGKQTVKGSGEFRFISTIPDKMTLQSNLSTVGPQEQAVIEAKVLDSKDNPVKNILVEFTRIDPSNGSLSSSVAQTDADGKASVTFTAGSLVTAKDAVVIMGSVVANGKTITALKNVYLTVGGEALFITIARGNTIEKLQDTELGKTNYALPLSIAVTDAAGQAVRNSQVSLQVVPTRYLKGEYYYNTAAKVWQTAAASPSLVATGDGTGVISTVSSFLSPVACASEDRNGNGFLDFDGTPDTEDKNGDGALTPRNPVTVSGHLVTNESGRAAFTIQYGQSYANWLEVKLIASTGVAGSESKEEYTFVLPVLAADVANENVSPPGGILSPYGNSPVIYVQDQVVPNTTPATYRTSAILTDTGGASLPLSTVLNTTPVLTNLDPCAERGGFVKYFYKRN